MATAGARAREGPSRLLPLVPLSLALLGVLAVYAPVLRIGPVAEDFQFALKGAKIGVDPAELLRPFQLVWRPSAYVPFTLLNAAFGPTWVWYRATQIALACTLAIAGWIVLRRLARFGPWLAAGVVALWLLSPLADEVICGETSFIGHEVFGVAMLYALVARLRPRGWYRTALPCALVVVALLAKEEAVVLPPVFFLEDLLLRRIPWRRAARSACGWSALVAMQLATYGAITHFAYRGFYSFAPTAALAKIVLTIASFFHLTSPTPWQFGAALTAHPVAAPVGAMLLLALTGWLIACRERAGLFFLSVGALLLLPTLPSGGQAGRWTYLPWLCFLAALVAAVRRLREVLPAPRVLDGALAALALAVFAADAVSVRGGIMDWVRFAALTRRLEGETAPLLAAARLGDTVVVLRERDSVPLQELLISPEGEAKFYFPRPDDPYGVVSLSALLSWRTFREGFVLERVKEVPRGGPVAAFVHENGGFRRLASVPNVEVRHPEHVNRGVPGVILTLRSWASFHPVAFP